MNARRRKRLLDVEALLSQARGLLEKIASEERESLYTIPLSLQETARYGHMQYIVDILEESVDDIERTETMLEEARG